MFPNIIFSLTFNRCDYCFKAGTHSYKFFSRIINIYNLTSLMCNFWLLLPKTKRDWALASVPTQFEIFLIFSCFLRSQVWSRWDRSFDKCFCKDGFGVMLSCFEDLLFVWEPADLAMSWHLHPTFQNRGGKF